MRLLLQLLAVLVFGLTGPLVPGAQAAGFSFSTYAEKEAGGGEVEDPLAGLRCPAEMRSKRIATMIGEIHRDDRRAGQGALSLFAAPVDPGWDPRFGTRAAVYGSIVDNLNDGFRQLGLTTYSAEEINAQIAEEEQQAFLNNNLEAALSAADRLRADFMIKGLISTHTQTNKVVKVEEVFVTINLSLVDHRGAQLATVQVSETAFSTADVPGTIGQLIQKQSKRIVAQLFAHHCREGN